MVEPRTEAGKKWLQDSHDIPKKMKERIIAIENEILEVADLSHEEFELRKEHKKGKM